MLILRQRHGATTGGRRVLKWYFYRQMSFLRSNFEIFTLQIIVFCHFHDKVTVQLRTEEEMGSDIDIIKCSFCDFLPGSGSGNFLHMKSRKSLLLESGILALESGIQLKKSRITACIQNPRLSWIHNKDRYSELSKERRLLSDVEIFFMWSILRCTHFLTSSPLKQQSSHSIFTWFFTQTHVFLVTFAAGRSGQVT